MRIETDDYRLGASAQSTIGNLNRQSAISIDNRQSQSTIGNQKIGNRQSAFRN
jgi:hypothetical protein